MKSIVISTFFLLAYIAYVTKAASMNVPIEYEIESTGEVFLNFSLFFFRLQLKIPFQFSKNSAESGNSVPDAVEPEEIHHGSRQKRATCDLASFFNVNDSLCAAHCIAKNRGFRGGYCNPKKVCVCRR